MNIKNLALGIGIIVIFALTLWQGIEVFYPSPQWDNYCAAPIARPVQEAQTQADCQSLGGKWTPEQRECITAPCPQGYCDYTYSCQRDYDAASLAHSKIVFIISIIVALIVIIIGYTILSIEPVGSALIGSGIWAIFWGTLINWRNFSDIWRFLLLLVVLVFIIWLAARLNKPKKTKKKKK